MSFGRWATRYFEFKSDAKSGAERLADSTLALRRSIYTRILAGLFGKLNLDEIKPVALGELLDRVKTERGPGPAVHARELVLQVYRFADGKGVGIANPAEALARKAYATFVPRERNLNRHAGQLHLKKFERRGQKLVFTQAFFIASEPDADSSFFDATRSTHRSCTAP
jgi:hypothetical protein